MILLALYVASLTAAYMSGSLYLKASATVRAKRARSRLATYLTSLVVVMGACLQLVYPPLLAAFERDAPKITAGEWWRMVTALLVQDGGPAGGLFNIACLLLIGGVAEELWGARRWLLIFFIGAVVAELVALRWQPTGAGNSVANFSLAASVSVLCVRRSVVRPVRVLASTALCLFGVLLLLRDIHGAAAAAGAIAGIALMSVSPRGTYERYP